MLCICSSLYGLRIYYLSSCSFFIHSDDELSAGLHSALILSGFLCFESVDLLARLAADQAWSNTGEVRPHLTRNNTGLKKCKYVATGATGEDEI